MNEQVESLLPTSSSQIYLIYNHRPFKTMGVDHCTLIVHLVLLGFLNALIDVCSVNIENSTHCTRTHSKINNHSND